MQGWKTREWKTRHQTAGVENAGLENAAPDYRGGKRGSGKCRSLKSMESEDFKNVFLTVLINMGALPYVWSFVYL